MLPFAMADDYMGYSLWFPCKVLKGLRTSKLLACGCFGPGGSLDILEIAK